MDKNIDEKTIAFYILTFVLITVVGKYSCKLIQNRSKWEQWGIAIGMAITIIIIQILYVKTVPEKFEINPVKSCFGWPYMQQETEEGNNFCQYLLSTEEGRQLYLKYAGCAQGMYNGEEVDLPEKMGWINQPFSDDHWESPLTEQDMHTTSKYF